MTVVVIGPHGVGKSTVGRRLARALGVPFHDEVGERLARATRPATATAGDPQEALDEAIFAAEFARDLAAGEAPRVVETWHPGNLAYAAARSPRVAEAWLPRLRGALGQAICVPLRASPATLAARRHEPGDPAFFLAVGLAAEAWARSLGLPCTPPVHTDRGSPEDVVRAAIAHLESR
ncbi:MAG: AAA family ATPase [Myxococcota bacterium]